MKTYAHPGGFMIHYDPETGFLGIPRLRKDPRSLAKGDWVTPTIVNGYLTGNVVKRNSITYSWVSLLRWISGVPENSNVTAYVLHFRNVEDGLKAGNLSWLTHADYQFLMDKSNRISKTSHGKPYRVDVGHRYLGAFTTFEEAQQVANAAVQNRLECIHDLPFTY